MSDTTSSETVVAEISMGVHDGALVQVLDAVKLRVKGGAAAIRWRIDLPDHDLVVTEDDITLGELERVERDTGVSWTAINPAVRAALCGAILRTCLETRAGKSADEAKAITAGLTADDVTEAMSEYEVASPPLDLPSTT